LRFFSGGVILISVILLSACANLVVDKPSVSKPSSTIGPYSQITARIMVIEPEHVWQAMLNWQAKQADTGTMRVVHAASGRIVEIRWHDNEIWIRDNQSKSLKARRIGQKALTAIGIVISPQELSEFLGGHVPSGFQSTGSDKWMTQRNHSHVRVMWNPQTKHLVFSDIRHGRKATLIILKNG